MHKGGIMQKWFRLLVITACLNLLPLAFSSCSHARPPKPGPHFVWVEAHKAPDGHPIHGHWKYVGPEQTGKTWILAHYDDSGVWVAGHWKSLPPPRPGHVWVPGHYGPRGKWIPGRWK